MSGFAALRLARLMRFSRAQIIGAIFILALIWLVIAIRLIISRA